MQTSEDYSGREQEALWERHSRQSRRRSQSDATVWLHEVLSRETIADLARLSESAVMYDLSKEVWTQAKLGEMKRPLTSREKSVFFAPPSIDGYKELAARFAVCDAAPRVAPCKFGSAPCRHL